MKPSAHASHTVILPLFPAPNAHLSIIAQVADSYQLSKEIACSYQIADKYLVAIRLTASYLVATI